MQGYRRVPLHIFMLFFYNKTYATMVRETAAIPVSRGKIPRRIRSEQTADPENKGEIIMAQNVLAVVAGDEITEEELQAFTDICRKNSRHMQPIRSSKNTAKSS